MTAASSLSDSQSFILGVIQGLAEYLPISSSAHIIIFSEWFGGKALPLALNVGLHGGTLLAVIIYFWRDLRDLCAAALRFRPLPAYLAANRLGLALVAGTVPAATVGLLFKDRIEGVFHHGTSVIAPLIVFGWLMWWVDRRKAAAPKDEGTTPAKAESSSRPSQRPSDLSGIGPWQAILIGIGQAAALIPGVSRSGATLTVGRWLGLDRVSAARFSFLLGIPAMLGAVILEAEEIRPALSQSNFYWGFFGAMVTGFLTIHFLMRLIRRIDFIYFALYRTALALLLLALLGDA